MANLAFEVEALGRRETFNKIVNHVKTVIEVVGEIESNYNIADVLNDLIAEQRLENYQVGSIVSSLLLDKYNYEVASFNLEQNVTAFDSIADEIGRWKAVDLVLVYFHPELGIKIINPKKLDSWSPIQNLKKNELINIYAGSVKGGVSDEVKEAAIEKCVALLNLQKVKAPPLLLRGAIKMKERKAAPKRKAPARAPARGRTARRAAAPVKAAAKAAEPEEKEGQKKMTPFYSIPVTNELFHNGNVEAWKKVIESYTTKYPGSDVYIFYEGERIHDINTLFKWGKVKHGSSILIAVAGNAIKDVAKLQRYLRQGASPMFEAFLKFPVNHILNLF